MPGTKLGTIHIDKALTDFSLRYSNIGFVADEIFPRKSVANETDKYYIYGRESQRVAETLRGNGAEANQVDSLSYTTATYTAEEHALKDFITDRDKNNADSPLDLEQDTTLSLTEKLMLAREVRVAALCTTTANFPAGHYNTLSGTDQWNNASFDSDDVDGSIEYRIDTGKEAVRAAIGSNPNCIVIPEAVAKVMKRDATIRDLIKHTHSDLLVNGDLPPTLWNMKVLIPGSVKDSAVRGATFSGTDVWGKHVFMFYRAPGIPRLKAMTFGLTMEAKTRNVKKWYEDKTESTFVQASEILVEKIVSNYCGYVLRDVIA